MGQNFLDKALKGFEKAVVLLDKAVEASKAGIEQCIEEGQEIANRMKKHESVKERAERISAKMTKLME